MANPAEDLPPGAAPYSAGPLANQLPPSTPSAAAVRASGQSPDSYFAPGNPGGVGGVPVVPTAAAAGAGFGGIARGLLDRAAQGFSNLFGGTPATVASAPTNVPGRTSTLESGLNALEVRSTGFRQSPNIVTAPAVSASPKVVVAANSAADEFNNAFNSRQTLTPQQANEQANAQFLADQKARQVQQVNKNLPVGQQPEIPTFYQQKIAENK